MDQSTEAQIARARKMDPKTSHDAAAGVTRRGLNRSQTLVWDALKFGGRLTDEELVSRMPYMSPSGARSRRAELVRRGLVRKVGMKLNLSLREVSIWGLVPVPAGKAATGIIIDDDAFVGVDTDK